MTPSLVAEEHGRALFLELRRAPVNVLDLELIDRMEQALAALEARGDLRVAVFRSGLPGVFSAGVDVAAHAPERVDAMLDTFHRLLRRLDRLPQATVAAIDGPCLGGACELASLCDIVLAAPRATFGQPEIDLGCFPPVGAVTLPRLMGKAASAMVLGGEPLSAAEAARLGLVTAVVDDLAGETDRWVTRLSAKSGTALAGARRALRAGACGSLGDALERTERLYRDEIARSPDAAEGVAAFLAKRPPRWERG